MGAYDINETVGFNIGFIWSCIYHAILPIFANVFIQTAGWALLMRGSSISIMGEDLSINDEEFDYIYYKKY